MSIKKAPGQDSTRSYLSKDKPPRSGSPNRVTKDREFWCTTCSARVTVSSDWEVVFGHRRDCPHHEVRDNGINGNPNP